MLTSALAAAHPSFLLHAYAGGGGGGASPDGGGGGAFESDGGGGGACEYCCKNELRSALKPAGGAGGWS